MADLKITQLSALTAATTDDILPIVDSPGGSPVTKKITLANLNTSLGAIGQIPFPAARQQSADANTLDDYEEGTFTPTLTFTTPGDLNVVYTTRTGFYTTIGRVVSFSLYILTSTFTYTTASGQLQITGMPFTSGNLGASYTPPAATLMGGWTQASNIPVGVMIPNTAILRFYRMASGAAIATLGAASVPTTSTVEIYLGGVYYAAT